MRSWCSNDAATSTTAYTIAARTISRRRRSLSRSRIQIDNRTERRKVSISMRSPSDEDAKPPRDAAEVVFAEGLRRAVLADEAGHARVLDVGADADPAVQTEFRAAVQY